MSDDYEDEYHNINPQLRDKWIAERRAWDAKMVRVERIWQLLIDIWDSRNTEWGWGVYYAIEKAHGVVPEPDQITPELVHEGLLKEFDDQHWLDWVNRGLEKHTKGGDAQP